MLRYFCFTVNYNITFRRHTFTLYLANGILGFIQGISAYKNEMLTCSFIFPKNRAWRSRRKKREGKNCTVICDWTAVTFIRGLNRSFLRCSISSSLIPTRMSRARVLSLIKRCIYSKWRHYHSPCNKTDENTKEGLGIILVWQSSLTFCYFGNAFWEICYSAWMRATHWCGHKCKTH